MRFRLLGGIAVIAHDGLLDLGPARQRCVLAALAVDAGRVVSVDRLVDRVWGERPPQHARTTLMSYLSRLRQILACAGDTTLEAAVVRRPGGYALKCEPSLVDLHRFQELRAQARATANDEPRAALLEQALEQWHGEALTGIEGEWAAAERDRLHQQLLGAECDLTDVLLRLGHGEDLLASLSARTAQWPLDERVAAQFMVALHRAGRTADALAHYRQLRDRLVEQLGGDPGTALQNLHQRILAADPALTPPSAAITGKTSVKSEAPVPRQLPAPPRWFTGRGTELVRLDQALTAEPDEGPHPSATGSGTPADAATVVISAIGGAGGIGKTWLALRWAHRHAELFPDGQLFTDLRGFTPTEQPVAPDAALFGFLTALGVAPDRVPTDQDAKAALYRSLVAGRRMLIMLDNAANAEQVIPLLPGGDSCAVVVTSRRTLTGLITRHGAHHLPLDTMTDDEARVLLTRRLGAARVAAEPQAVAELVGLCGGLPLALGIIASRAHAHSHIPLAEFAADLRSLGLGALEDDDPATGLPTVLSWSYHALTTQQQIVFGLLGIAPGPDIGLPAAANLTGLSPAQAARVLRGLEEASLLSPDTHGRYSMHDLIRRYATNTAHQHLPDDVREAALRRVVDFYLHTAHAADLLLDPHRPPIRLDPPAPATCPHPLPDDLAAMVWFDSEHANLLSAQHAASTHSRPHAVWHLAWALDTFYLWRGHRHDQLLVWRAALDAVADLPEPVIRIRAHRRLGRACADLKRPDEAIGHLREALALAVHHHDPIEEAHTHRAVSWAWTRRGDDQRALEHATRALDLFRTMDQPVWVARALNDVGWYAARLGDYDTARTHCQAALTLHQHHHDPEAEADTLDSLGYIEHHIGHYHRAIRYYQQALTLLRDRGSTYQVPDTLDNLGHPHTALGDHDHARIVWQEALQLYRGQHRDDDAARVQRQLDDLDTHDNGDQLLPSTESAK